MWTCNQNFIFWFKSNFIKLHLISRKFNKNISQYIVLNWNYLWDEALNLRINFYLFIYCGLFPLILVVFCVVSSFTMFRPNSLWPSSGDLPRPRIGMLSLVTVSPVITAFHSCCLSHHVFDQVNLWPAWVGFETAIFWQCSPGTEETQRLYPLCHGPRRAIKDGFFGLINPYLVSQSRVRTDFLYIVLNWNHLWDEALNEAVITGDTVTRLSIPIRGRSKSPEEGQREFGRNVVKEETTQKTTKMRGKSPQ